MGGISEVWLYVGVTSDIHSSEWQQNWPNARPAFCCFVFIKGMFFRLQIIYVNGNCTMKTIRCGLIEPHTNRQHCTSKQLPKSCLNSHSKLDWNRFFIKAQHLNKEQWRRLYGITHTNTQVYTASRWLESQPNIKTTVEVWNDNPRPADRKFSLDLYIKNNRVAMQMCLAAGKPPGRDVTA